MMSDETNSVVNLYRYIVTEIMSLDFVTYKNDDIVPISTVPVVKPVVIRPVVTGHPPVRMQKK